MFSTVINSYIKNIRSDFCNIRHSNIYFVPAKIVKKLTRILFQTLSFTKGVIQDEDEVFNNKTMRLSKKPESLNLNFQFRTDRLRL